MRMVGQPCRHINLKTNPATEAADLSLRASASGHLLKRHVQVAMYLFPSSVFWRGPIRSIPTVCQTWSVTAWDWMDASWGLTEFGVGTLAFVTGLGHLQYVSDDTHPVVSFLNLHHFAPSKVCSTDWVIMASFEDLLFLFRFYHLHITLTQGNICWSLIFAYWVYVVADSELPEQQYIILQAKYILLI